MATTNNEINAVNSHDHAHAHGTNGYDTTNTGGMTNNGTAAPMGKQRKPYDYGGNPLAQIPTHESARLPAFGGEFQPGTYKPIADRKIANPAPLGLSAFALTTFVLSLINMGTRGVAEPNIVVGAAFAYGGLVQLLAGMWEMAIGNVFGATALSSYGGFWIGTALILTPSLNIPGAMGASFDVSFGFYLMGWFIFTFILLLLTLRSTVAFFLLFFTLDLAFLMLGIGYLTGPNTACLRAGGAFGILAAFLAWYNAIAGMADRSNSFFQIPVAHFPWSDKGRERRSKVDNAEARAKQEV